jgi:hypothetical protein
MNPSVLSASKLVVIRCMSSSEYSCRKKYSKACPNSCMRVSIRLRQHSSVDGTINSPSSPTHEPIVVRKFSKIIPSYAPGSGGASQPPNAGIQSCRTMDNWKILFFLSFFFCRDFISFKNLSLLLPMPVLFCPWVSTNHRLPHRAS